MGREGGEVKEQENNERQQPSGNSQGGGSQGGTGDPGRTPSKAEGDEQSVEESLNRQQA